MSPAEAASYRLIQGVNFSLLKTLAKSPLHYRWAIDNETIESRAMRLGTAAHTAVLERHKFLSEYALWSQPTKAGDKTAPRSGKAWKAFQAANSGKQIITLAEHAEATAIGDAVRSNPDAARLLKKGQAEVVLRWADPETGRQLKGRADWITTIDGRPVVVGLKTARDHRPVPFGNAAFSMLYHVQWAMYHDGYEAEHGVQPWMVEIVVENKPPYDSTVYEVPEEVLGVGRDTYRNLLLLLAKCEQDDHWPGSNPGIHPITLPSRAYESADDLSDLGLEFTNEDDDANANEEAS